MIRVARPSALVLLVLALGCGAHKPPAVPARPVPPTDPFSWVPEQATVVGRLSLDALRDTPLWRPMWSEVTRQQRIESWVDLQKVAQVTFGGTGHTRDDTSYVAALEGRFDPAELRKLAARDGLAPEPRGLLTVYTRPDGVWTQISEALIVTCTPDRVEALVARASAGPDAGIKNSPLYRSLAERVDLAHAHFSMIAEDPEGKNRASLDRRASSFGLGSIARDAQRVGVGLQTGGTYRVLGVAEAESSARAEALASGVRNALDGFASNFLVRMLGVAELVSQLAASRDGNYVLVRGSLPESELNAALARLQGAFDMAQQLGRARQQPDVESSDAAPEGL